MDTQVAGVMLATRSAVLKVKVCRYADDTDVYIRSPTEVGAVLRILEMFSTASGLRVNVATSIAISLRPGTSVCPIELGDLKVLRNGENCRYLGVLVGAGAIGSAN